MTITASKDLQRSLTELLSNQELKELTGYAYKDPQVSWLQRNSIKHVIGADGRARVYRAHAMKLDIKLEV